MTFDVFKSKLSDFFLYFVPKEMTSVGIIGITGVDFQRVAFIYSKVSGVPCFGSEYKL
jgi:hypothetical protein